MANRLAAEQSPYLLQHQNNPVDWYPWGEEALERARREDKPIFLSIGYSSCHWCHVMEEESFENAAIAARLNKDFIPIKVDREEQPEIDEIYMAALVAMTGQGGWPLSAFLTPQLAPFHAGSYFPPEDRWGRPGFARILDELAEAWSHRRDDIEEVAGRAQRALAGIGELEADPQAPAEALLDMAYENLQSLYDGAHGGFGGAPKFPRTDFGQLCLQQWYRHEDVEALRLAKASLLALVRGGIHDQLGGGFHRYSTDAAWLVPHFEKMLYDNGLILFHLAELQAVDPQAEYVAAAEGLVGWLEREMVLPGGGFASAQDADSDGGEGNFFVWTGEELRRHLGDEAESFMRAYGASDAGHWEGKNVLHRKGGVETKLAAARQKLFEIREGRPRPATDDKVLSAWNGLMIRGLARAAVVFNQPAWLELASNAADFVLGALRPQGKLLRSWRGGHAGREATAEDHCFLVQGLFELYQANFELRFLEAAFALHTEAVELYVDPTDGALWATRSGRKDLLVRAKSAQDGSTPSATSVHAHNLLTAYGLRGAKEDREGLERILAAHGAVMRSRPLALPALMLSLAGLHARPAEVVLGGKDPAAVVELRNALRRRGWHPALTLSFRKSGESSAVEAILPPTAGKDAAGRALAWVCRHFQCERPSDRPEALAEAAGLRRA